MQDMPQAPLTTALAFVNAINHHDVDELFDLMSDGHRFIDSLGNIAQGRENMREAWVGYFNMFPDYQVCVEESIVDGSIVVMLGTARGTYLRQGEISPENSWHMPAAWRAHVEDGKILEWRVYADNEPVRRVLAKN